MPITANIRNPSKKQGLSVPSGSSAKKGYILQKTFIDSLKHFTKICDEPTCRKNKNTNANIIFTMLSSQKNHFKSYNSECVSNNLYKNKFCIVHI